MNNKDVGGLSKQLTTCQADTPTGKKMAEGDGTLGIPMGDQEWSTVV